MYAVEVVALQGLGLVVDRGELMALVGASGSRRPDAGRDKIETPTVLDLQLKRAVHGERQRIAEELPEMRGGWKATR